MASSEEDQKFYQPQFTTEFQMLAQQMVSKLRPAVTEAPYQGEGGEVVKQIGIIEANVGDEASDGDTPDNNAPKDQRWVYPSEVNIGKLFKRADAKRILADPAAQERQAFMAAMNRAVDRKIIMPAFFGTSKTGKNGAASTVYNTGNDVASTIGNGGGATAVGMNTAKLIAAREKLALNDVDMDAEELWVAITPKQMSDLLNDIKATNRDYNGGDPVLRDNRLKYWGGFNFVELNGVPVDPADSSLRWNPIWCKSGMHLGVWENMQAFSGPDVRKKFNTWLYLEQMFGATRVQEAKVGKIISKES